MELLILSKRGVYHIRTSNQVKEEAMSKLTFVTYDGNCCYFEQVSDQTVHEDRIATWLKSGCELSVFAFCLTGKTRLDMFVAVGLCNHRDLYESVMYRDSSFWFEGEEYRIDCELGGFCVKKDAYNVIHTRDSLEFGGIKSYVGKIHQQFILFHLTHLVRMASLNQNRLKRKRLAPSCKKPILSIERQVTKLQNWRDAYDVWDYGDKGGFPEIPEDIVEIAKSVPELDGYRPAVEVHFYLATPQEHLDFVFEVLWKNELKKVCGKYGTGGGELGPHLKDGVVWPSKSVRVVGIDIEAYLEEEGVSAWRVRELESDPIHVESFTHLLMHGVEYKGYIPIPGFNFIRKPYTRLGYRVITEADGIALGGNEECLRGFIASRIF